MTTLSEFLKKSNTREYSTRTIAEKATDAGHKMSHITASRYLNGNHPTPPNPEVLDGFAYALGISKEKLYELAKLPARGKPFELPDDAAMLDEHERQAVLGIIQAFIRTKKQSPTEAEARAALAEELERDDLDLAAYRHKPNDEVDYDSYH